MYYFSPQLTPETHLPFMEQTEEGYVLRRQRDTSPSVEAGMYFGQIRQRSDDTPVLEVFRLFNPSKYCGRVFLLSLINPRNERDYSYPEFQCRPVIDAFLPERNVFTKWRNIAIHNRSFIISRLELIFL